MSELAFDDTGREREVDLAIVGAGPAGMAAAATAADQGLRVALIDAGRQLGGQYFRHPAPGLTASWLPKLYHGWQHFEELVTRVETASGVEVLFGHQVWAIEQVWTTDAAFRVLTDRGPILAPYVLLATGAYERVVPFPGWDLPGVFTAGGAQALLKGNLVLPGRRVVVAGTGPLLLPVAAGLATAGAKVLGLYEANPIRGYAKNPLPLLSNPGKVAEGLDYARQFTRARIPVHTNRMVIEAQGTDTLEAVVVARPDGTDPQRILCDTLAVGYGLTPQIDLALTLGAAPDHLSDGTIALRVNTTQRTTVPGLYAAGETAGVAGMETALVEGEIAALAIARTARRAGRGAAVVVGGAEPAQGRAAGRLASRAVTAARSRIARGSNLASSDAATGGSAGESEATGRFGARPRPIAAARARFTRSAASSSESEPSTAAASSTAAPDQSADSGNPAAGELSSSPGTLLAPAPPPPNLSTLLRRRTRLRALADLLRARHPIPDAWREHLAADTIVCRCEEVPASAITEAVGDLGAGDARTVKLLTRAGMGWCQGRVCGYAVACLARGAAGADAASADTPAPPTDADLLAAAKRPLARPIPLSVLAEQDRRNN